MALQVTAPLTTPSTAAGTSKEDSLVGRIVHYRSWQYGNHNIFCVIVKETPQTVLLAELPTRLLGGDLQNGTEEPVPPDPAGLAALLPDAFRALKTGTWQSPHFLHKGRSFRRWDGKPQSFCSD